MTVRWAWLLAAATSSSCGSESAGPPAPSPATTSTSRAEVRVSGWLTGTASPGAPPPPVAGATICIVGRPETVCVASNAVGFYELSVPANARLTLSYAAPEHVTTRVPLTTFEWDVPIAMRLTTTATASAFASAAGFAFPDATAGYVILEAPPGSVTTLRSAAGVAAGPFYTDGAGAPSPGATSVASGGFVAWARVPEGPFVIEFSPERAAACMFADNGWDRTPRSIAGHATAGDITLLAIDCR